MSSPKAPTSSSTGSNTGRKIEAMLMEAILVFKGK
jgi:hypothetical protein